MSDDELPPLPDFGEEFTRVFEEELEQMLDESYGSAPVRTRAPTPSHWAELSERIGDKAMFHQRDSTRPLEMIGRFEGLGTIGEGGFGTVFKVRDPDADRLAALKLCRRLGPNARSTLLHEARMLAKLERQHRNILTLYEVGQYGDAVYMVTEYVDGCDMHDYAVDQPRAWECVLELFLAVGEAVAAAHAQGVIHGDIKPANMLVESETKTPYLVDFGMARFVKKAGAGAEPGGLGTPEFTAPELRRGGEPDERSDQFAFCVSLWQCLESHLPYPRKDREGLTAITSHEPLATREGIPEQLRDIVRRGLSPVPEERYANMSELLHELALARGPVLVPDVEDGDGGEEEGVEITPSRPSPRARMRVLGPVLGLVLGMSMTGVLGEFYMAHQPVELESQPESQQDAQPPDLRALAEAEFKEAKALLEADDIGGAHEKWSAARLRLESLDVRRAAEMSIELSRLLDAHLDLRCTDAGDGEVGDDDQASDDNEIDSSKDDDDKSKCDLDRVGAVWIAIHAAKSLQRESLWLEAAEAREHTAEMWTAAGAKTEAEEQRDCAALNRKGQACED